MKLQNLPIKRKLSLALMLTSGVALVLACGAFVVAEVILFRKELATTFTTRAKILAANSSAALAFDSPGDARELFAPLKFDARVDAAALYDERGNLFATYPDSLLPPVLPEHPDHEGFRFTENSLLVFSPVRQGNRQYGTLFIKSNLNALRERLVLYGGISVAVIAGAACAAYLLGSRLQTRLSQPIVALANVARAVTERSDYSVRATKFGTDELGQLTEAFNTMLAQIQERDDWLRRSEERFRSLVTATAQIVWHTDASGAVKGPLPSWQAYTGQSEAAVQGSGWADALHPDDLTRALEVWKQSVKSKSLYDVEYRIRRHDGEYRHFVARGVPVLNEDGNIREWVGTCTDIHDRNVAEVALRESEARKTAMFETALDCIITMDHEGRVIEWNPAAERTFGFTREQALGQILAELIIPPSLRDRHQQGLTRYLSSRKAVLLGRRIEMSALKADGVEFPVEMAISAIEGRKHPLFTAYLRDITGRKRIEDARSRLAAIVESSEDAIIGKTLDGSITNWNPAAERILGYSATEIIGQPMLTLFPPERLNEEQEILNRIQGGEKLVNFETVRQRKDGQRIAIAATISPIRDSEGRITGASTIVRDITERKAAAEALERSEARFRSLVTATSQIVWNTSAEGMVSNPMSSWRAYTGQTEEEVQGAGWSGALHPDDVARTMDVWRRAVEARSLYEVDYRIRRHDGVYREFTVRGAPVLNEDGRVREWMGTCTDVTERKQAEETIHNLNAELEQRVIARTAQLEVANKELEAFSYSISHDLRAPLRGVIGYARILIEDCAPQLDDEGRRLLDVVASEAGRMGQLIDDLLEFSRMGRQQLAATEVNLTELVRNIFARIPPPEGGSVPELKLATLPPVRGDLSMLRQVFANLLGNAIKFSSHHPHPVIEVGFSSNDDEHIYHVQDNGVGFDEQYKAKLFGVFQRLHSESEFEGTGVGLALVQRIVHRHGGRVWAESKLNEGATFYVALPKRKVG